MSFGKLARVLDCLCRRLQICDNPQISSCKCRGTADGLGVFGQKYLLLGVQSLSNGGREPSSARSNDEKIKFLIVTGHLEIISKQQHGIILAYHTFETLA